LKHDGNCVDSGAGDGEEEEDNLIWQRSALI